MQNNHIVIKEQQKDWLLKGFIYLGLMILSLVFTFIPLFSGNDNGKIIFYIIGGLAFTASTTVFVLLLYKVCNPGVAMILNARGFIDKKNVGDRIVVDWTNVSAIKQLGKNDMPYLGVSLENSDIVLAQMKSKEADAMRENFNNNLPAILIAQNEIRMSVKELKELFTKYAREARALASDNEHNKQKVNPYSTDDVIKNFQANDETVKAQPETEAPAAPVKQPEEEITEAPAIANNFYEELLKQAEAENEVTIENSENAAKTPETKAETDIIQDEKKTEPTLDFIPPLSDLFNENESAEETEDEKTIVISEEFTDILNQARSTKILELDKLLNDKEEDTSNENNIIIPSFENEEKLPEVDKKINVGIKENEKIDIKISDLESMIESALLNVESAPKKKTITEAPIIDIEPENAIGEIKIDEIKVPETNATKSKKKKTFVLNEKK